MERIRRSWALAMASLEVLKKDKELMIFPFISSIGVLIVTILFAVPTLLSNIMDSIAETGIPFFGYMILFLFYLVQYSVIFYCNTALVGAVMIRLRGGDPNVRDGFTVANTHLGPILGWALLSATVGILLHILSDQSKKKGQGIGSFVSSLFGAAWNIVTFLVVPVLAVEGLGPIKAVQRSWELLKKSWGEQIAGTISIGLSFGLIGFAGVLLLIGAGVGLSLLLDSAIPAIVFGVLLVFFVIALNLIQSTLSGIFTGAVYAYAVDGRVGLFDEELINGAIRLNGEPERYRPI